MRFVLPDLDISIEVALSDVVYQTKAVAHLNANQINLLMNGYASLYSSMFKPLAAFDCGGRTIGEDWVRHVSYQTYQMYTHPYVNKNTIISGLNTSYQNEIAIRAPHFPEVFQRIQKELISRRRLEFIAGDLLMYTTTISHGSISKKYLMHVILE